MKNKQTPKGFTAKAWSGMWQDGNLGWWMSDFIHPLGGSAPARGFDNYSEPETVYRVRVRIDLLRDKRGRLITKRVGPGKETK